MSVPVAVAFCGAIGAGRSLPPARSGRMEGPKSKLKSVFAAETQGKAPAHPPLVRLQLRQRSPRHEQQGHVDRLHVRLSPSSFPAVPFTTKWQHPNS